MLRVLILLLSVFFFTSTYADSHPPTRLIIKFKTETGQSQKILKRDHLAELGLRMGLAFSKIRTMSDGAQIVNLDSKDSYGVEEVIAQLNRDDEIEFAEVDRWVRIAKTPNDSRFVDQWSLRDSDVGGIGMPAAWDITTGSSDIVIAVVDTGVRAHADLSARLLPGYDLISSTTVSNDGDGRDADANDPGDWSSSDDFCGAGYSTWHGTHVAGIIAAASNNEKGIAGVNWVSKILPVRVLGRCGGYMSDIAAGIRWAAGVHVSGVPDNPNPAQVINLSLGAAGACGYTEQNAINDAVAAGAFVVVAAGNAGGDVAYGSPASCDNAFTVAAVTRDGKLASYSNTGEEVAIAAPGGGYSGAIVSTYNSGLKEAGDDSYYSMQGTSMAAPHVAGVASLMLSVSPSLTPAKLREHLLASVKTFPTGTSSDCTTNKCGAGILDAAAALRAVSGNQAPQISVMANRRANPGQVLNLTATASDPEGKAMSYLWTQVSGPLVSISQSTTTNAVITVPAATGSMVFQFSASDEKLLSANASVTISINQAPIAHAGRDRAVATGQTVFLDGTESGDDLGIASYSWQQIEGIAVSLSNSATVSPQFLAPATSQVLRFRLTVSDGDGLQSGATVSLNVNHAPVAVAGPDVVVNPGDTVTLSGAGSYDTDGSIRYHVWQQVAGETVELSTFIAPVSSFVAPQLPGWLSFDLSVQDDSGLVATDRVSVYVNEAPHIQIVGDLIGNVGDQLTLIADVQDADGSVSSIDWLQLDGPGVALSASSGDRQSFVLPSDTRDVVLQVTATDNMGLTATHDVHIQINQAPRAFAVFPAKINPGANISLDAVISEDPNNNITQYQWQQLSGPPITLLDADKVRANFVAPTGEGHLDFLLTVSDALGLTDETTISLLINKGVVIAIDAPTTVNMGDWVNLDAAQSADPDGYITRFEWTQLSGTPVDFVGRNSMLAGFYAPYKAQSLRFRLRITDDNFYAVEREVSVNINQAPVAKAGADIRVTPGSRVTLDGTRSLDVDGSIASYQWQQFLGESVVVNNALSSQPWFIAPAINGVLRFRLTVADDNGELHEDDVSVVVSTNNFASAGNDQTVSPAATVNLRPAILPSQYSVEWTQLDGPVSTLHRDGNSVSYVAPARSSQQVFLMKASDGQGRVSFDVVEVTVTNKAPVYDMPSFVTVNATEDVRISVNAQDDNQTKPVFKVIEIPAGAGFDEQLGEFYWNGHKSSGAYRFVFSLSDADDPSLFSVHTMDIRVIQPGEIRFSNDAMTVNETDGNIMIPVTRQRGSEDEYKVKVRIHYDLSGPEDAMSLSRELRWQDGEDGLRYVFMAIIDDLVGEGTEKLTLQLLHSEDDRLLDEMALYIVDDDVDDTGLIDFEVTQLDINEGDGKAIIKVRRKGGAHGEARVLFHTEAGNADAGTDYVETTGELFWSEGENDDKIIAVEIYDDDIGENDEALKVHLNSFGTINVLSNASTVVIKDNDPTCFIATAAYGTGMAPEVRYLRAFRDEFLLSNYLGRKFVEFYYDVSPPIADYLRQHTSLRETMRTLLEPLIAFSKYVVSDEAYVAQTDDKR
ncbi:MAG: S8 family serine peptidase [Gammaproteobacteria bacterium]|nr:S8 family serine peptidase [Gammaproteobacteria bacterium]